MQTRLGAGSDPNLPAGAVDAVVVVDVYPEVEQRVAFLRNLAAALTPNGRIGVVNYLPGEGGPGPSPSEGGIRLGTGGSTIGPFLKELSS